VDSPWAPLFTAVVEPNAFTAKVEQVKQVETLASLEEFWEQFDDPMTLAAVQAVHQRWMDAGHRRRLGHNHVVLEAAGPSKSGVRTVVAVYSDGRVLVPFGSYAGQNSGIPIEPLTTSGFRTAADALFGFSGLETMARTGEGWVSPSKVDELMEFCFNVADAYKEALTVSEDC
jgi:uncharacterized protein YerC